MDYKEKSKLRYETELERLRNKISHLELQLKDSYKRTAEYDTYWQKQTVRLARLSDEPATILYEQWNDYHSPFSGGDYQPIVELFGEPVVQASDSDYQGDTFVLYHEKDQYQILIFGWGSCSGCDALQACDTLQEIDELIESLRSQMRHFETLAGVVAYFNSEDRAGDYQTSSGTWLEFREQCLKHLLS